MHPICGHPVAPSWALSWCTACTVTDNAIIGLYMAVELCNLEGTKRLGSIADPPNFDSLHSPEECSIASIYLSILSQPAASLPLNSSFATSILTHPFPIIATCHPEMSVYLHPLSIPSRNSSMSDASPYTQAQSESTAPWSSPTTHSRRSSESTHFLNIPGPTTPHIKDADSVDKEANAAAAAAGAATASSCPSSQSEWRKSKVF